MKFFFPAVILSAVFYFSGGISSREAAVSLPEARQYRFQSHGKLVIAGDAAESGSRYNCSGHIPETEIAGSFTIISTLYQNGCWTDGRYNHRNWQTEYGTLSTLNSSESFPAVRISPPSRKADQFLASRHRLAFRVPEKKAYALYLNQDISFKLIGEIKESEAVPGSFFIFRDTDLSAITEDSLFAVVPADADFGPLFKIKDRSYGARFQKTPWGHLDKVQIEVNGEPFDTASDFTGGPADHSNLYGINRQLFFLQGKDNLHSVLWQDKKSGDIRLTRLSESDSFVSEFTVYRPGSREILLSAASDRTGHLYFFTGGTGKDTSEGSLPLKMFRVSESDGKIIKEQKYSSARNGMNVFTITENFQSAQWVSSLEYNGGILALILSRIMHKSNDGLNHQGAIAVTFKAGDLSLIRNLGQTSGHSFGNFLIPDGESGFIAADTGDNYPRGIHLHRILSDRKDGRVVFSFKTAHATTPRSPSGKNHPVYSEISRSGRTYYQWSNDNRTYSEPGGVAPAPEGYLVLVATERPMLDNSRSGENLNDPRDLAVVYIRRDFHTVKAPAWNIVAREMVLSSGESAKAAFYDFGGRRNDQENNGVVWLTKYGDKKRNASRPRILRIGEDRFFVMYEEWDDRNYKNTRAMEIRSSGEVTVRPVSLGNSVRIGRQDDIYFINGRIIILNGHRKGGRIEIISLRPD